jgi:hypothetical protein
MLPVLVGTAAASASTAGPAWHKHHRCTPVLVRVHHHHHHHGIRLAAETMWGMQRAPVFMNDHRRHEGDNRFRVVLVCRHQRHEHHNRHCDPRLQFGRDQQGGYQHRRDPHMGQCPPFCEHRMMSDQVRGLRTEGLLRQFCPPPCPVHVRDTRVLTLQGEHEHGRMCGHDHGRDPGHKPYPTPKPTYKVPDPTVTPSYTPKPKPSYTVTPTVTPSYTVTPTYAPAAPAAS